MNGTSYKDASGVLVLGRRLGKGGEGEVFALENDPTRALKIYANPDPAREAKILAMTRAGLASACANVAFPMAAAFAPDGGFAGFTMQLIEGGLPVHEVHSPMSRRRELPNADWRFLIRTAANIARVVRRVHDAGAVIGDVNGSGILVSRRAVVSLIDADSFQLGVEHPCRVGVPEYTPPELQNRNLNGLERTVQHDAYGLAVLAFQLLFLGRHPAAGIPSGRDMPLTEAIRQNVFAYSLLQRPRIRPPAGTLLLSDLPSALSTMFERAFAGLGNRPTASEWIEELEGLEAAVTVCGRNVSHQHVSGHSCPWCRIDAATGRPTFSAAVQNLLPPVHRPNERQADALALAADARRHAGERLLPITPGDTVPPSPAATALALGANGPNHGNGLSPEDEEKFRKAHRTAARDLDATLDHWRRQVDGWFADRLATEIAAEVDRQFVAADRHDFETKHLRVRLRAEVIANRLRGLKLAPQNLTGIGSRLVARLADSGISTAHDVTRDNLERVHGFGERGIMTLLLWRAAATVDIERSLVPCPRDEQDRIQALGRTRDRDLVLEAERLDVLERKLRKALADLSARAGRPDPQVVAAVTAYRQTAADLRLLGISSRTVPANETPPVPSQPSPRKSRTACPRCGGSMVKRWARNGATAGRYFLGCAAYPVCTGSLPIKRRRP